MDWQEAYEQIISVAAGTAISHARALAQEGRSAPLRLYYKPSTTEHYGALALQSEAIDNDMTRHGWIKTERLLSPAFSYSNYAGWIRANSGNLPLMMPAPEVKRTTFATRQRNAHKEGTMPKPTEYKHLAAWGHMMGSMAYYVKDQQELAARDNAPLDAIYKREDGWHRFADVTNSESVRYFEMHFPELLHSPKL